MSALDDYDILVNPGSEYYKKNLTDIIQYEGWSFALTDYETWLNTCSGFWYFMAVKKGTDVPAASVCLGLDEYSNVSGEPLYGIGMYFCHPEHRGFGLGRHLWNKMMQIPPKDANITLNGVLKMAPRYAEVDGFVHMPFQLKFAEFEVKDLQKLNLSEDIITKNIAEVPFSDVETYDNGVNPRPHPKFLKKWMINEGAYTRVAYDKCGKVLGFCCVREDAGGNLACNPLYAENKNTALKLLHDTLLDIDLTKFGKLLVLFPDTNKDCEWVLSELSGGKHTSLLSCYSQFTKKIVECESEKIYSVADSAVSFM